MRYLAPLLPLLSWASVSLAEITVHYQPAQATFSISADAANYTGSAAYNPTKLNPPAPPNPAPPMNFFIQLQTGGTPGASIVLPSAFIGFSIEMSVANQVLGHNSSLIQVPFLNLMANLVQRAGAVHVRVGGNTQDYATLIPTLGDGKILEKDKSQLISNNPTQTPPLLLGYDLLYLMRGISSFTNVRWYLGVPFNDTNFRLAIVDKSEEILGDYLLGLQAGNEPDFYGAHGHRAPDYGPANYVQDVDALVKAMGDDKYKNARTQLIVPSIANSNGWLPQQLWDTGFVDTYKDNIKFLAVERYPDDNCAAAFPTPGKPAKNPQDVFPNFLTHDSPKGLVGEYLNDTAFAQSKGKPFLMFETNTASCGGFAGISDSFGAALWGLDYALQMAHANFSGAMFHVGGQSVFYNPFTAPPTNQSAFHQWTIGSVYYSALVMAEIMGNTNTTQVLDMQANGGNPFTPCYAIYQNGGQPSKLACFNYITDASGANSYTVSFAIGGSGVGQPNATPPSGKVKFLLPPTNSVADKGNFTWAGQTFGDHFASDGRLQGTEDIKTVQCNQDNTCTVQVPAPGFALIWLNGEPNDSAGDSPKTFSTSTATKAHHTLSIDPAALATSNGHAGISQNQYSTSEGSTKNADRRRWQVSLAAIVGAVGLGMWGVIRRT